MPGAAHAPRQALTLLFRYGDIEEEMLGTPAMSGWISPAASRRGISSSRPKSLLGIDRGSQTVVRPMLIMRPALHER